MAVVSINKDLSSFSYHGKKTFGTTATQLLEQDYPITKGIQLKAASTNTHTIHIGSTLIVTAGTNDSLDGFPLSAGEGLFVPCVKTSSIYCIASAAGQKLFWFAI